MKKMVRNLKRIGKNIRISLRYCIIHTNVINYITDITLFVILQRKIFPGRHVTLLHISYGIQLLRLKPFWCYDLIQIDIIAI